MTSLTMRGAFAVRKVHEAIAVISTRRKPNETLKTEKKVTAVVSGAASGVL
jgi:hypothetical protein